MARFGKYLSPVKKTEKKFWNGYTGYRESGAAIGATAFGMAGYGYISGKHRIHSAPKLGDSPTYEEAPIQSFDAVTSTKAPTLGANGGMVFGMHNARKG